MSTVRWSSTVVVTALCRRHADSQRGASVSLSPSFAPSRNALLKHVLPVANPIPGSSICTADCPTHNGDFPKALVGREHHATSRHQRSMISPVKSTPPKKQTNNTVPHDSAGQHLHCRCIAQQKALPN